jgi:hypothetical protein
MRTYSTEYVAQHTRLRRTRGSASGYLCECGSQAKEWATIHGCDGSDIWNHYIPACFRCHKEYDEIGFKPGHVVSEECKQKLRDFRTGRKESSATRSKLSSIRQGRPLSPSHRRAIQAAKYISANSARKLQEDQVIQARKLYKQGVKLDQIKDKLDLSVGISTIHFAVSGRTWKYLDAIESPFKPGRW